MFCSPASCAYARGVLQAQKLHQPFALEWENLSYVIKGQTILSDISGRVATGEMLAGMVQSCEISRPSYCAHASVFQSDGPVWGRKVHHPGHIVEALTSDWREGEGHRTAS